jgi:hypothetical protein
LRSPEDFVSYFVFWFVGGGGRREDYAREFGAGNPRQWRLMLVFPCDLEEVKEIGRRGMDGN